MAGINGAKITYSHSRLLNTTELYQTLVLFAKLLDLSYADGLMKYLCAPLYYRYIRQLMQTLISCAYTYVYNATHTQSFSDRLAQREAKKFHATNLSISDGLEKLNTAYMTLYKRPFNFESDSIHHLLFACLSLNPSITRILEIGTFTGDTTALMAMLFDSATISTVDLPNDDPILTQTYDRADSEKLAAFLKKQTANTTHDRIVPYKHNSFFLMDHFSPHSFDLVWVDGGHHYPEIAWDTCQAYHLTKPGGYVLFDDVLSLQTDWRRDTVSTDSYRTLAYLADRLTTPITYFLKRRNPLNTVIKTNRDWIALLQKQT